MSNDLENFTARLGRFIRSSLAPEHQPTAAGPEFARLAMDLFQMQFACNTPYRTFCESLDRAPASVEHWCQIPAMPAVAFKELAVTCLPEDRRSQVFESSGTTRADRGRHYHCPDSLRIYEASLVPWFERHVLPEMIHPGVGTHSGVRSWKWISLTPTAAEAPHSSLVHMFSTLVRRSWVRRARFLGRLLTNGTWDVDVEGFLAEAADATGRQEPVLLVGTAFSFVHLLDVLEQLNRRVRLPRGSRILETGGYKGRSRVLPKPALHRRIEQSLGVLVTSIVSEYGMSELSSQAYDKVAGTTCAGSGDEAAGAFSFPPWAKAMIVSPENGREVEVGETGLVQVFDLANVWSVMAVQTEDLAVRAENGFALVGRLQSAEPRGCSLMTV